MNSKKKKIRTARRMDNLGKILFWSAVVLVGMAMIYFAVTPSENIPDWL